jgi:hypothetical protein
MSSAHGRDEQSEEQADERWSSTRRQRPTLTSPKMTAKYSGVEGQRDVGDGLRQ